jgi:hypothetical protein
MQIFAWEDRKERNAPRAMIQQGRCEQNQCGLFSISISNGEKGMTFDSIPSPNSATSSNAVRSRRSDDCGVSHLLPVREIRKPESQRKSS